MCYTYSNGVEKKSVQSHIQLVIHHLRHAHFLLNKFVLTSCSDGVGKKSIWSPVGHTFTVTCIHRNMHILLILIQHFFLRSADSGGGISYVPSSKYIKNCLLISFLFYLSRNVNVSHCRKILLHCNNLPVQKYHLMSSHHINYPSAGWQRIKSGN